MGNQIAINIGSGKIGQLEKDKSACRSIENRLRARAKLHNEFERKKYSNIFPSGGINPNLIAKLKRLVEGFADGNELAIQQVLSAERFCYIIGEGGMGKSTSLLHLLERADGDNAIYYLFALNSLNDNAA